jgi:asparagine N-glycosylation enzyme membrane subunit Stt3
MGDLLQPYHLILIGLIFGFPSVIIGLIPFWFICKKAGFSPLLSLLNLIPFFLGTLPLVYFLAFAPWKPAAGLHSPDSPQS